MLVFKFGGASVNSSIRIKNAAEIVKKYENEKILIIFSAIGKTTNDLEVVARSFYEGKTQQANDLFNLIKNNHRLIAQQLLGNEVDACLKHLSDFFTEAEWLIYDKPVRHFDYYYDQIVSLGELLSTVVISHYFIKAGIQNYWLDVRDIFRTDNHFRDATPDWNFIQQNVNEKVIPIFKKNNCIITQGFIGATADNESVTLGREGSDFSAAIFANMLPAKSQTIWKDVPSVMNADPKIFSDAVAIAKINYTEIIEMAFYGAQVIHPKTIKPLQNKNIPLYVKCFLDASLPGTIINNELGLIYPPIIVIKNNQAIIQFSSKDFSFIGDHIVGQIMQLFEKFYIKPNLMQNGAITFSAVLDDRDDQLEELALAAAAFCNVQLNKNYTLLTVRHYTEEIFNRLSAGKEIILLQRTKFTIQAVLK